MLRYKTINVLFLAVVGVLLGFNYFFPISLFVYALLLFLWFLITMLGSTLIRWDYHLISLHSNKTIKENYIAITFDDGPNREFTPRILSLLKKYNAKATFFCIGKHIGTNPELFRKLIAEGHTVGNHTYSHSNNFGFFSSEKVVSELRKTNSITKEISGLELKLYRPAFGVTNPNVKMALQLTKLTSIGWSKRSLDTTGLSEENIVKRITKNLKKGDIILLHDLSAKSVAVLEHLLLFLQTNKMQAVTVDQLLEIEPYA